MLVFLDGSIIRQAAHCAAIPMIDMGSRHHGQLFLFMRWIKVTRPQFCFGIEVWSLFCNGNEVDKKYIS